MVWHGMVWKMWDEPKSRYELCEVSRYGLIQSISFARWVVVTFQIVR